MFEWELHGRDFTRRTLVIRQETPNNSSTWRPIQSISKNITDFFIINSNDYKIEQLFSIFENISPIYLFINPFDLRQLATYFLSNKSSKKSIRLSQVVVIGHYVDPGLRSLVKLAFDCEVINHYSCNEVGYIAFQCPLSNHLHPNLSSVYTEILNSKNLKCSTGEEGKVIITDLNPSPTPLIRYEIGDLALVGEKCHTNLNLQTIEKIAGRQSDRIINSDGTSFIPQISEASFLNFRSLFDYKITIFENLYLFNAYSFTKLNFTQREIIRSDVRDIFKSDMPVEVEVSSVPRWKMEQRRVFYRQKGN
jgi:phenylacetate-CoA ligase